MVEAETAAPFCCMVGAAVMRTRPSRSSATIVCLRSSAKYESCVCNGRVSWRPASISQRTVCGFGVSAPVAADTLTLKLFIWDKAQVPLGEVATLT